MVKINLNLEYPNALFKGIGTQFGEILELYRVALDGGEVLDCGHVHFYVVV